MTVKVAFREQRILELNQLSNLISQLRLIIHICVNVVKVDDLSGSILTRLMEPRLCQVPAVLMGNNLKVSNEMATIASGDRRPSAQDEYLFIVNENFWHSKYWMSIICLQGKVFDGLSKKQQTSASHLAIVLCVTVQIYTTCFVSITSAMYTKCSGTADNLFIYKSLDLYSKLILS